MAGEARSVVVRLTAETSQYIAQMKAAGAATVSSLEGATRITDKQSRSIDQLGGTAGKAGLAAAAGFAAITITTAKFDKQMSAVAATGQEARGSLDELRAAAIAAGADTAFSASEAAQGIEELLKAGVSTTDVLSGGLSGSLDLAAAGNLDVASAAELSATALTQFGLAGTDVSHVADLLSAGAGKAQGSVADLGAAMNQSGLVAAQTGLTIEETVGTLAAFASAGLTGSDAGTSFKTMLQSLTPASEKSAEAMEAMGFSAYDSQGNFKGMTQVAADLREGLSSMTVEQQNATLKTIFGSDAVRAASVIYDQGASGIQGWIDKTNDSGYAAETAATRLDNLSGDLEALGGSLETALIGSGEGSTGMLRNLTQGATAAVNAFNSLPAPIQSATTGLLAITAIGGGGLFLGGKIITGIADTRAALADLGSTGTKVAGGLRALGAAAGIAAGLYALGAAATAIESQFDRALPSTEALTSSLLSLGDAKAAQTLTDDIGDIGAALGRLDQGGINGLRDNMAELANQGGITGNILKGITQLPAIGLSTKLAVGDTTGLREAHESIEAIDSALVNIVNKGSAEQAQGAFDALAKAQGLNAAEQKQLLSLMPGYQEALASAANSADLASGATDNLTRSTAASVGAQQEQAAAVNAAAQALRDKTSATLGAFDAETAYRQAVEAAREQAEGNNAGIDSSTEAALKNREALSGLAASWNGQSAAVKNNTQSYEAARSGFIAIAEDMGVGSKVARKLANDLLEIPRSKIETTVQVRTDQAASELNRLTAVFNGLPENVRTDIKANGIPKTKGEVDALVAKYKLTERQRTALLTLRDQASRGTKAAQALLDRIAKTTATATVRADTGSAIGQLQSVASLLASIPRNVTSRVVVTRSTVNGGHSTGGGVTQDANGGFHVNGARQFDDGGYGQDGQYYSRTPQIVPGGADIRWGEKETGWEAYISGKPGQEARNLDILDLAAGRLGASITRYANGGHAGNAHQANLSTYSRTRGPSGIMAQLHELGEGLGRLSKKELLARRRDINALSRQIDQRQKLGEREVEADKRRLDTLKEAQKALEEQVASLYVSDLFTARDRSSVELDRPENFATLDPATQRAILDSETAVNAFQSGSLANGEDVARADTARAREALRLYGILRGKGLDGPAFRDLVGNADIETLRAYAALPKAELASLEQAFVERRQVTARVGRFVGAEQQGAINAQTRVLSQSQGELKEIKQSSKEQNRRIEKLEKAVTNSIDKAAQSVRRETAQAGRRRR